MSKKNKKEILTIDRDYAIISAANNLIKAETVAEISGDLEILLAASDRWLNIYSVLSEVEAKSNENKIGFYLQEDAGDVYGRESSPQRPNKGKGRFKVRKKSGKL